MSTCTITPDSLIEGVRRLSADELEKLLEIRAADDKAIRVLWRAALARERAERQFARERADVEHAVAARDRRPSARGATPCH